MDGSVVVTSLRKSYNFHSMIIMAQRIRGNVQLYHKILSLRLELWLNPSPMQDAARLFASFLATDSRDNCTKRAISWILERQPDAQMCSCHSLCVIFVMDYFFLLNTMVIMNYGTSALFRKLLGKTPIPSHHRTPTHLKCNTTLQINGLYFDGQRSNVKVIVTYWTCIYS